MRRLLAIATVGAFVLAACSDDDESSSTEPAASETTAGSETTAATETTGGTETTAATETTEAGGELACDGPAAEGDPVKIGVSWPVGSLINYPELGESAQAAADYANDCMGGIGGRPIEIDGCPIDETDSNAATLCGNQFVEDGVAAAVITITAQGQTLAPLLTDAGIPYIVSGGSSSAESLDSTGKVFSLSGGVFASLGAMAIRAKDEGISKVALLVTENAAGGVGALAGIPFNNAGIEYEVVPVPVGTADMTPQVQTALSGGAGATAIISDGTMCISYLQAVQSVDPDGQHWIIVTCIGDDVVEAVGEDALDGAVIFGGSDPETPEPERDLYEAIMAKYSPDTPTNGFTPAGYGVMMSFVRGVVGISGEVNAESITATMKATKDIVSTSGFGMTYSCSEQPLPPLTVCSGETLVGVMDGATVTNVELVDASAVFTGA